MSRFLLVLFAWLLPLGPAAHAAELADRMQRIVDRAERNNQRWGVYVERLDTGEAVFSHHADTTRIPASNVKLFTTAAALEVLGTDYTFHTSVYATAKPKDGTVHGDLLLYGRGDPNISGRFTDSYPLTILRQLARQVRESGVRSISGNVVGDGSYFEDLDFGPWKRKDEYRWYAARVNALSFNDNCLDVLVWARPNGRPLVRAEPHIDAVRLTGAVQQGPGKRRKVMAWRESGANIVGVGGTIGRDAGPAATSVALLDPAAYTAAAFYEALSQEGVEVDGAWQSASRQNPYPYPKNLHEIARLESQPLPAVLKVINSRSQNLHAELVTKTLGRETGGDGSWADGLLAVDRTLCSLGVDMGPVRLVDGSGLGRGNRATPRSLVSVLRIMASHPLSAEYQRSLIQVGVDPYLSDLRKSVYYGELFAKTGSLNGVLALSGYVRAPNRAPLAYALVGENAPSDGSQPLKATRDALAVAMVQHGPNE